MPQPDTPNGTPDTDDGPQLTPQEIGITTILDVLQHGTMQTTHGLMRYSSNYTFLITMEKDDLCLPAIYKPRRGERPLWDFPEGTLYKRERASFLTAQALGWGLIPPTVIRDGSHGVGSVQFYIDHDPDVNYFSFEASLAPQLARLCLLDVLVNNADRKGGHCLLDANNQLWGIDHGITFNQDHKLRTVIWDFAGEPIPAPLMASVKALCDLLAKPNSDYLLKLKDLLNPAERAAFQRRVDRVIQAQVYPVPGPGPNYPWPAV